MVTRFPSGVVMVSVRQHRRDSQVKWTHLALWSSDDYLSPEAQNRLSSTTPQSPFGQSLLAPRHIALRAIEGGPV